MQPSGDKEQEIPLQDLLPACTSGSGDEKLLQRLHDAWQWGQQALRIGSRCLVVVKPGDTTPIFGTRMDQDQDRDQEPRLLEQGKPTNQKAIPLLGLQDPNVTEIMSSAYHHLRVTGRDQTIILW